MFGFPDTENEGITVPWNARNYYPSIPTEDHIGLRSWLQHAHNTIQWYARPWQWIFRFHKSMELHVTDEQVSSLQKICIMRFVNVCTFTLFLQEGEKKIEYRVWNPFRSKLAAAILGGVDQIYMPPGSKVLYLGAASGTTVSHVSDVVGPVSLWNLLHHFCRNSLIFNIYFFPICATYRADVFGIFSVF